MLSLSISCGDRGARDQQVAQLRQREQAEQHRRQRQAVPKIEAVEGPAQRAGLRVGADHRDHDAEAAGGDAAQRRAAGQHGHHRYAEHRKRQQLRRAEIEHHRPQDRDRHREQHRAEHAAHQRRHVGGAERAPGLAPLRHREAVEHRCRGGGTSGHAEQDRGNRIAGGGGGAEARAAARTRSRGPCAKVNGSSIAVPARPPMPGHDAEHQPHHAAGHQVHQPMRLHQRDEGLARRRAP